MGEVIAQGKTTGGGSYSVVAFGPWLDVLEMSEGRGERNALLRNSLIDAGTAWANRFLGRRFTNYIKTAPFFYDMGVNAAVRKFRRMGFLQPILAKEFRGWDPWSNASPPKALIEDYRRVHPETRGAFSRSGNYLTITKTIRSEAKRIVRDFVGDLMSRKLRPLVETGAAEKTALAGRRILATVTKARCRLAITIPFGGPRNKVVGQMVRTMPPREVAFMAKTWAAAVSARLRGKGLQAFVRGNHEHAPSVGE